MNPKDLISEAKAAEWLGISRTSLLKLRASEKGPAFYRIGERYKYDEADLSSWLKRQRSDYEETETDEVVQPNTVSSVSVDDLI